MTTSAASRPPIVALVLGSAVWPGGVPSPTLERRSLHAVRLYHEGIVHYIIGCGGIGRFPPSEASVIRDICLRENVPPDAILMEDRSTSTLQNISFALPLLAQLGTRQVAIVTDDFHIPRALLTARRMGLTCIDVPAPPPGPLTYRKLKARLREIPAFLWYLLRRR